MKTEARLSQADYEALARALELARSSSVEEAEHLADVEAREGWLGAAESAVFFLQTRALALKPWQPLLYWFRSASDIEAGLRQPHGVNGERAAAELVQRLLKCGLSRYEPDPRNALRRAERARRNARVERGTAEKKTAHPVA
jgi:hypothetical protein